MDGVLARLYIRMGRYYWLLLVAAAALLSLTLAPAFVMVAIVRYLGAPASAAVDAVWVTVIALLVGVSIDLWLILRRSRPALDWIRGERREETATAAWESAVHMPTLHVTIAPWPIGATAVVPIVAIARATNPSPFALAALAAGGTAVVALGLAIHMVTTGAVMRPVLADIDARFPQSGANARVQRTSLRPRIVISSLLVVVCSAWLTAGLVARTTDASLTLVLSIVTGLGVGLVFGLILTVALSQSLFSPLEGLTEATKLVRQGDLSVRVPIVSSDELGELSRSFNEMVGGLAEREALRSALGVYVEPGIADRVLAEGEILRGEEVDVTVMFVDIVGFSARAEMMPAEAVCSELNEFFGLIVPVVEEHGGHTNKLIGDGLMAVFGTPMKLDDHADRALAAACTAQQLLAERYRGTLRAGIGLHSGSVVVGTMGGGSKLDFTLIGDAVNVASRVEALTRRTGDSILLTEATKDALRAGNVVLAARGTETVRGRSEPVSLYAVASRVPA